MPALDLTPPDGPKVRRLNRLPIFVAIGLVVVFLAAVFWGLTTRGLYTRGSSGPESGRGGSASSFADQMKRGVTDGIIGEPNEASLPPSIPTKPQPEKPPPIPSSSGRSPTHRPRRRSNPMRSGGLDWSGKGANSSSARNSGNGWFGFRRVERRRTRPSAST